MKSKMGHFKECQEHIRAFQASAGSLDELMKLRKRIYAQESTRKSHLVRGVEELIRIAKKSQCEPECTQNKYWVITGIAAGAILITTYISSYTLWLSNCRQ